jgi:hypothetical protein
MSALGSKADFGVPNGQVRVTPNSRHCPAADCVGHSGAIRRPAKIAVGMI